MPAKSIITFLFILVCSLANGQKIVDSLTDESCACAGKAPRDSSGKVPFDSVAHCISGAILHHWDYLKTQKKYDIGTVEGIMKLNRLVWEGIRKKCPEFAQPK